MRPRPQITEVENGRGSGRSSIFGTRELMGRRFGRLAALATGGALAVTGVVALAGPSYALPSPGNGVSCTSPKDGTTCSASNPSGNNVSTGAFGAGSFAHAAAGYGSNSDNTNNAAYAFAGNGGAALAAAGNGSNSSNNSNVAIAIAGGGTAVAAAGNG
jgi:hypothetical protein